VTALDLTDTLVEVENLGPRPDFTPSFLGPVWRTDEDGDFIYPDPALTGGLQVIEFIVDNMQGPDGPWVPTFEQARFLLWWYAVRPVDLDDDDETVWVYRNGVIQKVKGWG